jgi:membrane protease YdiL (CAAX protease family)
VREAFGARYWEGFAIGVVNAGAVALGMIALGGMTVHGLSMHGSKILSGALAWLGACALVGVAEELLFRGYLLQTLWRSLGFWPAAVLISAWFAADHYFFKQGENVWDVITLVTLGLWACYSVLRTGTLWLAVGYHVSFDYVQLFVIGTKNGSVVPVDHLLNASFQGPAWVTGGVLGTEPSFFDVPVARTAVPLHAVAIQTVTITCNERSGRYRPKSGRSGSRNGCPTAAIREFVANPLSIHEYRPGAGGSTPWRKAWSAGCWGARTISLRSRPPREYREPRLSLRL